MRVRRRLEPGGDSPNSTCPGAATIGPGAIWRCGILAAIVMGRRNVAAHGTGLCGGLMLALTVGCAAPPPTGELKDFALHGKPAEARTVFESARGGAEASDAAWLEAMSWVGRAGAIGGDWEQALDYSERVLEGCEALLEEQPVGEDPNGSLAIALGASIETLAKVYDAAGDRVRAVSFLREQLKSYTGTSIETRLNKNLLLLDLVGKPMPAIESGDMLGEQPFGHEDLDGNVALFFFWAHWCEDCRGQKPVIAALEEEFGERGLRIVAPTRLYGYIERGTDAEASVERAYIERSHVARDGLLRSVPVPVSGKNFVDFGVSTTPTLVLVDRSGTVRLYHPGGMPGAELARRIEELL